MINIDLEYSISEHLSHQYEYPEFLIGESTEETNQEAQAAETKESRTMPVLWKRKHRAVHS